MPGVALAVAVDVEVGGDDRAAVEVGEVAGAGEVVEVAEAFGVGEEVEVGVEVVVEVGVGVEVLVGVGVLVVVEVGVGVEVAVVVGDGVVVAVGVAVGVAVEVAEAVGDGVVVVVEVPLGDGLPCVADVVYEAEGAARACELLRTASNPASENKSNVIESTPTKALVAVSLLLTQKFNRRVLHDPASGLFFILASFDRLDNGSQAVTCFQRDGDLSSPCRPGTANKPI